MNMTPSQAAKIKRFISYVEERHPVPIDTELESTDKKIILTLSTDRFTWVVFVGKRGALSWYNLKAGRIETGSFLDAYYNSRTK